MFIDQRGDVDRRLLNSETAGIRGGRRDHDPAPFRGCFTMLIFRFQPWLILMLMFLSVVNLWLHYKIAERDAVIISLNTEMKSIMINLTTNMAQYNPQLIKYLDNDGPPFGK